MTEYRHGLAQTFGLITLLCLCAFFGFSLDAKQTAQLATAKEKGQVAQLQPLSEYEADAIVSQRALEKEVRESQRLINRIDFTVMDRKSIDIGNRKVILNRVQPPNLPPRSVSPALSDPIELTEAQLEELMKLQEKPHRVIMLSTTVYDRKLTKLRWGHGDDQVTAWSNVDFNYIRGVSGFETENSYYTVLLGIGNESTKDLNALQLTAQQEKWPDYEIEQIPDLPPFTPNRAEYFVVTDNNELIEQDDLFEPIDALHAYYEQNANRLQIQYQRTEAINSAKKRFDAANPETPKDIVIHFWPKQGSAYQSADR